MRDPLRLAEMDKTPLYEPKDLTPDTSEKSFYVVYTDEPGYENMTRFDNADEAYASAERRAGVSHGVEFFVLRAVTRVKAQVETRLNLVPLY
jgi:hypothetical protein